MRRKNRPKRAPKTRDELVKNFKNSEDIMYSNLPLLFANGQPRNLETMTLHELEQFIPFMILCSLGPDVVKMPKEIHNCRKPEWWPQDYPFKFPLVKHTPGNDRHILLKSLICRCYTFYDCEYLLKFSNDLVEEEALSFEQIVEDETIAIYNTSGIMTVKCRPENLNYDKQKFFKKLSSSSHRPTLSPPKKFDPVIDLTYDTSSEDEKEVYFKEAPGPSSSKGIKRKANGESSEEPAARQRCLRRKFQDFKEDVPEPGEYSQDQFMTKFELIPLGTEIEEGEYKLEKKKRLSRFFTHLSVTSLRGQKLLEKSKHTFNLEASLERIDRYCGLNSPEDEENSQICTRASVVFSAMLKEDMNQNLMEIDAKKDNSKGQKSKWCHTFKWPHRTKNPRFPHIGPEIKPCSVRLGLLSEETIQLWCKGLHTRSTMTPDRWRSTRVGICRCQKIPLIVLDDEDDCRFRDKSTSTRCTCVRPQQHVAPLAQDKKSHTAMKSSPDVAVRVRLRSFPESHPLTVATSTRSVSHSFSHGNDSPCTIIYGTSIQNNSLVNFKRAIHRKPLAVVPPTPIIEKKEMPETYQPSCLPKATGPTASIKINLYRSILDAIKWYTKDDPISEPVLNESFLRVSVDRSQENIKPLTELVLPNSKKSVDYFQMKELNNAERDYCYERSSDGTRLVTRRGERHYVNREPCPSCFQGRDNFCVYEFVRQAKLAGVTLQNNQKQLQLMFFKMIHTVNSNT